MDEHGFDSHKNTDSNQKRSWSFFKILASLLFVVMVFLGGVIIGRGDEFRVKGLSAVPKASAGSFDYSSVDQVYSTLQSDFDGKLDKAKLLDGIKAGLVDAAGDPYTQYFNAKDAQDFNNQLSGSFIGIGAELGTDENNHIVVVSPLSGYPAEKAGLKPKDIVAAIDGKSISGLSVDGVVKKIRGKAGTQVTLTLIRGTGKPFDVAITRTEIKVPSVESKVENGIGYMKISQFSSDTDSLATKAAKSFKDQKVKGVVLDLRGDPGGYLDSAVRVSSLWLDNGNMVVSERRGGAVIQEHKVDPSNCNGETDCSSSDIGLLKGLPTVVLINEGSASASEITAGALRDNKAATLVGAKSFGKGSVQKVECLDSSLADLSKCKGPILKVTIARWYTPAGKNIDKQGITPDEAVTISDDDQKAGRDPQKDKAYLIVQSKF